jgi:hypothetical protein
LVTVCTPGCTVADAAGAQVGAAAAARLTFTIAPSNGLEAILRELGRLIGEHPWLLAIPALLVLLVAIRILRRRFRFSVSRRA